MEACISVQFIVIMNNSYGFFYVLIWIANVVTLLIRIPLFQLFPPFRLGEDLLPCFWLI